MERSTAVQIGSRVTQAILESIHDHLADPDFDLDEGEVRLIDRDERYIYFGLFEANPETGNLLGQPAIIWIVEVSADEGATWERRGVRTFPKPDWHEHMIVEKMNGSLWMLARTWNGIMESESTDGGRTWSEPVLSNIKHPVARFHIRRLASNRLLLVKHGATIDTHKGRSLLTAWLSDDDGKTWRGGLMLDERTGVSYPDGFQAPDGTIYISWDRNRSTDGEILMARFTEEDILAKAFKGPKSKTKMLISRPLAREVAKLPAFKEPTPGVNREIDMPLVDLSADQKRHSVVAADHSRGTVSRRSIGQGHR